MTELRILQEITQYQNDFFNTFARIFTFIGNEEFYFLMIPFVYWTLSRRIGFSLFYVFLLSAFVNSFIKITMAIPRPVGTEGIESIFVESAEVGSHYPNDAFPSGHAQGSSALWTYLALVVRHPLFTGFAVLLVLAISFSRLYTGLHWPSDVIAGLVIGVAIAISGYFIFLRIHKIPAIVFLIAAILIPAGMLWLLPETEGFQYGGILIGATLGFVFQLMWLPELTETSWLRKIIAFILGIVITFSLQSGLKIVFPDPLIFEALRYAILGIWITYFAPALFLFLRLNRQKQSIHFP
ncbi:phosphatase PAP2 family protein [Salisediminibacterium beveridgei]|uniref:Phosphoesterase PA-Phosphatase-Like Protein n=1 Tax=Salisediminibacterium beveridgei TaxID=632773 RepID=A0A1D7QU44_9BACI|nr:phosphatase PAP2 family protein [Salisediminibacterium beveridgei]AOM82542.1 Phosphoesterase PA-Phosphatase-Like Protein [Salisediminibacterium beveridgei]